MQTKIAAARAWLWGLGLLLVSLTAPIVYPEIPIPLARAVLWVGLALVVVPTLHMLWMFGKTLIGPQRSNPLRVLRDLPYRVVSAAQGFLSLPRARGKDAIVEAVATNALREVAALCGPAVELLRELFRKVFSVSDAARSVAFGDLVQRQQGLLAASLKTLLDEVELAAPLVSLRVTLTEFNDVYMAAVRALHDYGRIGVDLTEPPFAGLYGEWEAAHRAYCERVKQIREHSGLTQLHGAIPDHLLTDGEGWRWHSLYWGATRTLANLTPAQSTFLRLFTDEAPLVLADLPSPVMLNIVYRGGRELVESRMLTVQAVGTGLERFALREAARRAWTDRGNTPYPRRDHVDLDLNNVMGAGGSGGGAT